MSSLFNVNISNESFENREDGNSQNDEDIELIGYTNESLIELTKDLGLIRLSWPAVIPPQQAGLVQLSISYRSTSDKEKLLLWYANNFRRQYHTIYIDRQPLLLVCENECEIQKFVSTNIKLSRLPYDELYTWLGCAKFVSDHLNYEPLPRPLAIPNRLCSPTWILLTQTANAFEYSTLLASLLLGQGYNAYVVSGYASRERTLCDTTMQPCPYLPAPPVPPPPPADPEPRKYQVKQPPNFQSRLLMDLEEAERKKRQEEDERQEQERQQLILDQERPLPDKFWGRRVHSWVLLLPNDPTETTRYQELKEPIFIEPTTGFWYSVADAEIDKNYHGIESIWNDRNYWVNLQSCRDGCSNLNWDLENIECWEHLLPGESARVLIDGKEEDYQPLQDKHLDMPLSYVDPLEISSLDFERRYPNGKKAIFFKKTKVEFFAPYVQMDGLIEKITEYEDYEYTSPLKIYDKFKNRGDNLSSSTKDLVSGRVTDSYDRGRPDACRLHEYSTLGSQSVEDDRTIEFYDVVRLDGLSKIEIGNRHLTQHFVGRNDFLYHRSVRFAAEEHAVPQSDTHYRKIVSITEMFNRNPKITEASKDIAVREFRMDNDEIRIKYHYRDEEFSRATRTFMKPPVAERGERLVFDPSKTFGYDPNPMAVPERPLDLFYLLEQLLREEEKSVNLVRDAEKEISEFLKTRSGEYLLPKLLVSIFDENRNDDAKAGMFAKEEMLQAQSQRQIEQNIDYLRPYLAKLGQPKTLTKQQASEIRQECLNDYKRTLTDRANKILEQYDNSRRIFNELQKKLSEDDELTKEDKEKLNTESNKLSMKMHTLDIRLKRHVELSSERYQAIVKILDDDERLMVS